MLSNSKSLTTTVDRDLGVASDMLFAVVVAVHRETFTKDVGFCSHAGFPTHMIVANVLTNLASGALLLG